MQPTRAPWALNPGEGPTGAGTRAPWAALSHADGMQPPPHPTAQQPQGGRAGNNHVDNWTNVMNRLVLVLERDRKRKKSFG